MSSPSFVKVAFGDSQLVIPVGKGTDKVSRLIQDINKRFQSQLGDPTARVKELWTHDGYFVNPNDIISDVIANGAHFTASDYASWMKTQLTLLKESWHKVSRTDFVDDNIFWAEIGLHKHNKLYIKLGLNQMPTRLELFSVEEIQSFAKGGKPLITREQEKDEEKGIDRFTEASFVVTGNAVTAVELIVKATSDVRPQVERFSIPVGELKKGTPSVIQAADYPVPTKKYTLPETVRTGKTLPEVMTCRSVADPEEPSPQKPFEDNKSTGNCAIEMKQHNESQADQSWWTESSGTFEQYLYTNLQLLNKTDKPVTITKTWLEYQDKEGKWLPCDSISLGTRDRAWYYNWNRYDPKGFEVGPGQQTMAVRAGITVHSPSHDKIRRIHHSLPNPLQIKIWMEDANGGKSSIVVEYLNGARALEDEKSKRKNDPELKFFYCDDIEAEYRLWFTISVEQNDRWGTVVKYANWTGNNGKYFYDTDFKKILYQATKENKSEYLLSNLTLEKPKLGYKVTVTALVDLQEHYVYALKFDIKTNSSSVTEYYLRPPHVPPK